MALFRTTSTSRVQILLKPYHAISLQQVVDICTKPLGLDKLWQFSTVFGLQHLDLSNLRGRNESRSEGERGRDVQEVESGEELDFRMIEEVGMFGTTKEGEDMWDVWIDGRRRPKWKLAICRGSIKKNTPVSRPNKGEPKPRRTKPTWRRRPRLGHGQMWSTA